jgi:hypothetical protein
MRGALALVGLLVLAGCVAPTAGPGDGPAADAPTVEVRNGSLGFDAGETFARMQAVLGTNVSAPGFVAVVDDPDDLVPGGTGQVPRFWRLAGLDAERALNDTERERLENGVTTGLGGIRLYPGDGEPRRVEWLLAHEFVHYVQVRERWGDALRRSLPGDTDAAVFVQRGVIEGVAVHATDAYIDRHLPGAPPNAALYADLHPELPPGSPSRYVNLAYIAGARYVADRVAEPADAPAVFDAPPTTSEQLLHGTAESPTPLPISVETDGDWRQVGTDSMGEAFLRVALENGLSVARAERAAAGWGNDSLRVFRRGGGAAGYAWLLRFDDAANATEGAAALGDWLAARGETAGDRWRVAGVEADVQQAGERTVAVLLGPGSFVGNASVATEEGAVRVGVGPDGN